MHGGNVQYRGVFVQVHADDDLQCRYKILLKENELSTSTVDHADKPKSRHRHGRSNTV
jgi:hypothetical protein